MRPSAPSFLRVPPFPGGRPRVAQAMGMAAAPSDLAALAAEIVRQRVGGTFWERQPALPAGRDLVLAPASKAEAIQMATALQSAGLVPRVVAVAPGSWFSQTPVPCLDPRADPWHLAQQAAAIWANADADLALVAALCGKPLRVFGTGRFAALGGDGDDTIGRVPDTQASLAWLAEALAREPLTDPFTGTAWQPDAAVAQLGAWRALIEENRAATSIYGIARWKRVTMDAMLWDGFNRVAYAGSRTARHAVKGDTVLAWKSRVSAGMLDGLVARGIRVGEIEDGMIRSQGLGANCVPPLSVIVDPEGAHFDPSHPNMLERMLSETDFAPALLARAAALRLRLVDAGLSKYGAAAPVAAESPASSPDAPRRRRILVPGQVEDDRSVLTGGGGMTNLTLLERARALEPDAHITYRPHPDVEAGHRKGKIVEAQALRLADRIERDGPVTAAIDAADALHTITSLAGFEALMRGKAVTTHGVPFYAGWGLTTDAGAVPARRGRARTLDELVAAVLILYPRNLDPVTRLPCPVEILVDRLARGEASISSPLVLLRTWQSKVLRMIDRLGWGGR